MAKVLFCVGLRGNYSYFREVLAVAQEKKMSHLIFGGDTFPAHRSDTNQRLEDQLEFLEDTFQPFVEDLVRQARIRVLIHPGNNDLRFPIFENLRVWSRQSRGWLTIVADGQFNRIFDLPLLAYPYVPPTPCTVKDWEKWDNREMGASIPESFVKGFQSQKTLGITPVLLSPSHANDTIEGDLAARELALKDQDFWLLSYGPPFASGLDRIGEDSHLGSVAIRAFIERMKPKLSLHGHALAAPAHNQGQYFERIGSTLCINPGQGEPGQGEPCHYVTFDPKRPLQTLQHSVYQTRPDSGLLNS